MKGKEKKVVALAVGAGAALAATFRLLRIWQSRWAATAEEAARPMPLDDRVPDPTYVTNRAVTIRGAPEDVWPWLVQMGELPRAGFYSYVSVERVLGMKVRNAGRLLPEFQNPKVGEALDREGTMLVLAVEPQRCLVLGPPPTPDLQTTWALALYPASDLSTRLVSRCRARLPGGARGLLMSLILDPGQFLMERKMLVEIRRRVETRTAKRFAFPPVSRAS